MSAFTKQPLLYEMRPSSANLQLINVPFHSSHTVYFSMCVHVCVCICRVYVYACRHRIMLFFNFFLWYCVFREGTNLQKKIFRKAQSQVNLQCFEKFRDFPLVRGSNVPERRETSFSLSVGKLLWMVQEMIFSRFDLGCVFEKKMTLKHQFKDNWKIQVQSH